MSDLERARAQRPTITCAYCGGHDFEVTIVNLLGNCELRCVKYDEHFEKLGLLEKKRKFFADHDIDPDQA